MPATYNDPLLFTNTRLWFDMCVLLFQAGDLDE